MFNYKIIFRFFSLVFIVGIFFGLSNGGCITGTVYPWVGYGVAGVGSLPTTCQSIAPSGPQRFYNNQSYTALKIFLRSYGFDFEEINCSNNTQATEAANKVEKIQILLDSMSGDCSTCIDGKFGEHTKSKIEPCSPTCTPPAIQVNPSGDKCNSGFKLEENESSPNFGCCVPIPVQCTNNSPMIGLDCSSYGSGDWIPDTSNPGCCIAPAPVPVQCPNNNSPITGINNDCSTYGPGWIEDTSTPGCCKPPNPSITEIETECELNSGTLSNFTPEQLNCIRKTPSPCCIKPDVRSGLDPKPTTRPLEFCPTPNPCTSTGQIGSPNASGTGRDCKPCGSGTKPNLDNTKCICDSSNGNCCGIKLNTVVPFIGDCIEMSNDESSANTTRVTPLNAFPILMGSLSKILVTAILIFSFVMIVVAGVLIISGGINPDNFKKGKDIITKVVMALALLGASGIILRLINPNFFG